MPKAKGKPSKETKETLSDFRGKKFTAGTGKGRAAKIRNKGVTLMGMSFQRKDNKKKLLEDY